MKILHVITSLRTGGAEKLMVDLLPRLKAKGHNIDLLLFDGTETPFKEDIEAKGITVYDLGIGGSVYSPKNLFNLIPFLKRYDIVHTHNTAPQLFAAIGSLFGGGILCTTEHNSSNRRRKWEWYATIDRWMYSRYKRVICISQIAEENLRKFIGNSKPQICTINNGIDISKYTNAEPSHLLEEIAPRSRKIIMVAGFREQKDQDTLIKSLKFLPDYFHLFLVGEGVRMNDCRHIAEMEQVLKRVHFLGLRTDVPQLLHASDYIVMSSYFEGLSLSSVEGMCAGKPFIASDVEGLREVVNGAGVLFQHKNPQSFADEIMLLDSCGEKYKKIARSCHNRAILFSIDKMVKEYSDIYQSLK